MRSLELAKRTRREVWRDQLSLRLVVGLPLVMLLALQALGGVEETFRAANLAPGIVLFGYVMPMFGAAMTLTRDRGSAFFARLLTTPLGVGDFTGAYWHPHLRVAIVQGVVIQPNAALLGPDQGLGMIVGALFTVRQVPFVSAAVLSLTIFGGAWMDLEQIGGVFQTVGNVFRFAHALDATRDAMFDGAGLGSIATDLVWVVAYAVVIVAVAVFRRNVIE